MDKKMFWGINQAVGKKPLLDKLMIVSSNKVRYVYAIILLYLWMKDGLDRKATNNAILSVIASILIRFIVNLLYYKPRPFIKYRVNILIPSKVDTSYLSKHTLLVFAVSTSIYLYKKTLGLFSYSLACLTGLSRIWVGHHYPSDILRSSILGSLIGVVINKVRN